MVYVYLSLAIITDVAATCALKSSAEFTKFYPSVIVIVGYLAAFYFMALVLRTLPIGITYAVWSGAGIVLVAIAGMVLYKQVPDTSEIIGMGLIVLGVVVLNVFSETANALH